MANLSKLKRDEMLAFLESLKQRNSDEDSIRALNEIEIALTEKKYGLVWEKHTEKVDEMLEHHIPIFNEVKERKIKSDESNDYNFLLEGDNLHSLKLLEKTHKGKIDVIYIDPPYNTGNKDFMYNDRYVDKVDGYAHSKWLSFMSERLEIAKDLLSNKGVIFISINKYECAQLKLLCDEKLGENNLLGILTWESTTQPINAGISKFQIQQKCEFIYVYSANKDLKSTFNLQQVQSKSNYPHVGKFGQCRFEIIEKSDAGQYKRDSMKFEILGQKPRQGKRWQIGEKTARELEKNGRLEIVDGIVKKAIYPEDEIDKVQFIPFWSHFESKEVGTAQNGKDELNTILERQTGFDTVKPVSLIKKIISYFNDDITILDFFAGSGTTAHAVVQLNKDDGGNRKYILCTNNENNICEEITYQRLKKIQEELPHNLKYLKTDFIPKIDEDDSVSDKLLEHIVPLIELEYMCEIDNKNCIVLLDDELVDETIDKVNDNAKIYVCSDILISTSQTSKAAKRGITFVTIPEYYFRNELVEVGEL